MNDPIKLAARLRHFANDNRERGWKRIADDLEAAADTIADTIGALLAERDAMREALENLARLGNGDRYGNSDGNMIARAALENTDA